MATVTIIALCYNHAPFVEEALNSILSQEDITPEVIVIDDGSEDDSVTLINEFIKKNQLPWTFIAHAANQGNCCSFNEGLAIATGKYIIDFATDDVIHSNRVFQQVQFFEKQSAEVGLIHHNAEYIDSDGAVLGKHSALVLKGKPVPQGDVFESVLGYYFICPPTMMFRRDYALELNGYNESLAYEDFDFLLRLSRKWQILYQDIAFTKYRKHVNSLGESFKKNPFMHASTALICQLVSKELRSKNEKRAFKKRVKYQMREAWRDGAFRAVVLLSQILEETNDLPIHYRVLKNLAHQRNRF